MSSNYKKARLLDTICLLSETRVSFFFFLCFAKRRSSFAQFLAERREEREKESQGTKREEDEGRLSHDEGKKFKGFGGWKRVSLELREILTRKGAVQHSSRVL